MATISYVGPRASRTSPKILSASSRRQPSISICTCYMRDTRKQQYIAHGNHARRSCSAARQGWTTVTRAGARSSRRGVVRRPVCRRRVRQVASRGAWMDSSQHAVLSAAQSPPWKLSWRGCRPQSRVAPGSGDRSDESDQCDEAAASASRFALRARGPPAGASSKMAESVGGTSNDTVGSTANGRRSRSDYAGGGDRGLPRLRLREDQAARPPEPRRRSRAAGSARRGARRGAWASGPRPLKKQGAKAVFPQEAAIPSLPPAAAPADGRAR